MCGPTWWVAVGTSVGHLVVWLASTFVFLPRAGVSGILLARSAGRSVAVFLIAWAATTTVDVTVGAAWDPLPRLAALVAIWITTAAVACAVIARPDMAVLASFIRARDVAAG